MLRSSLFETNLSRSLRLRFALRLFSFNLSSFAFLFTDWNMPLSSSIVKLPSTKLTLNSIISCFISCLSLSSCFLSTTSSYIISPSCCLHGLAEHFRLSLPFILLWLLTLYWFLILLLRFFWRLGLLFLFRLRLTVASISKTVIFILNSSLLFDVKDLSLLNEDLFAYLLMLCQGLWVELPAARLAFYSFAIILILIFIWLFRVFRRNFIIFSIRVSSSYRWVIISLFLLILITFRLIIIIISVFLWTLLILRLLSICRLS